MRLRFSALRPQSLPRGADHCGTLLGDHNRRRVGVGRGDRRHHRGVDDPQPIDAVHAQLAVDDAHRVRTHQAGAAGVIAGAAVAPRVVEQLVVGLDLEAGQGLFADELLQHGRRKQPLRKVQAADDGAPVPLLRKIARVDRRRVARAVRLGLDIAARQRAHLSGAGAKTRVLLQLADLAAFEPLFFNRCGRACRPTRAAHCSIRSVPRESLQRHRRHRVQDRRSQRCH